MPGGSLGYYNWEGLLNEKNKNIFVISSSMIDSLFILL